MSAVRSDRGDVLAIADKYRGELTVHGGLATHPDGFVVEVLVPGYGIAVGLDLDDTLALLSFLADALGVERFVPQVELRDVAVVAQPLHPSWTVERVDDPAPGGAS